MFSRIVDFEWGILLFISPFLIFPTVRPWITVLALVVLVGAWGLRWWVRREVWPVTPFNGALLLLLCGVLLGALVSRTPLLTLPKLTNVILDLAVFRALVFAVREEKSLKWAIAGFIGVGIAITILGMINTLWRRRIQWLLPLVNNLPTLHWHYPELTTKWVHPNQLALLPVLYLPILLALIWYSLKYASSIWERVGTLMVLFLLMVFWGLVLLATQSRGGWIGGVIGNLFLLCVLPFLSRRRKYGIAVLTFGLILTILAMSAFIGVVGEGYGLFNFSVFMEFDQGKGAVVFGRVTSSLVDRTRNWVRGVYVMQDFSITGVGLGSYRKVVPQLYPIHADVNSDTHNTFLQVGVDTGTVGLVGYVAMLVVAGGIGLRRIGTYRNTLYRVIVLGIVSGLIGLYTYGSMNAVSLGSKPSVVLWMAFSMLAIVERLHSFSAHDLRDGQLNG